jgi:hypothetical protein
MEWSDDCLLDRAAREAKYHGMAIEEFLSMPDKQKHDVYCGPCPNRNCHAKRKYNPKS